MGDFKRLPAEVGFTSGLVAILLGLSAAFHLPIRLPTADGAEFVGLHYLFPLVGVGIWACCLLLGRQRDLLRTIGIALPCYAVVLIAHFNLKLWAPLINPLNYDAVLWHTDQLMRPIVDLCIAARRALVPIIPFELQLYFSGFIFLFYASFCYHAIRTPAVFRQLFLAALFFQGLGGLAYLVMPALGPFLFEAGASPIATATQQHMLAVHQQLMSGGASWISRNGPQNLLAGLGAMPSLHAGGTLLFLWFAIRHARVLLPTYVPLFVFILITSIANRWHYLIDLPFGLGLAVLSIWLSGHVERARVRRAAGSGMPVVEPAYA